MKKTIKKKIIRIPKFQKKVKWLVLLLMLLIVGGTLLFFEKNSTKTEITSTNPGYPSIQPVSTKNWKTYSNRLYGFTIHYPPDYTLDCYECHEQVDDDAEWTANGIQFKPPQTPGYGTIHISFDPQIKDNPPRTNEKIEEYIRRQYSTTADQIVPSLTKQVTVGDFDALQTVHQFNNNFYIVRTNFFYKDTLADIFFNDEQHTDVSQKMERAIFDYPNINIYYQMLKTFKPADLPKTRKITSLYKKSPDGTYYVRGKESGYGHQITLIDNKGNTIPIEVRSMEGPFAQLKCYECGVTLGDWVNDYQFSVKLGGAFMDENEKLITNDYEYLINAKTGKIELDTFKQVK